MTKKPAPKTKKKAPAIKKKMASTSKAKPVKKTTAKKTAVKRKAKVLAIPKGYSSITPYMIVRKASKAIDFYKKVFGAKEIKRMQKPDGQIGHAELKIGDTKIMLADECPESNARSPEAFGGSAMSLHLYVKDVDGITKHAVAAGAKLISPVQDMFYGDRSGTLTDPFGHTWYVSTHVEDVTPAKMKKRIAEMFKKQSSS